MKVVYYHFQSLSSTNDWAKKNFHSFEKNALTAICADMQTKGRGQFGRRWNSPDRMNIYASFCFFTKNMNSDVFVFTHLLALAAAEVLAKMGIHPKMKWPNDLLVSGRKIAGILCETLPIEDHTGVVLGIGLNVNMPQDALAKIDQEATSILEELKKETPVTEVFSSLKNIFQSKLETYFTSGFKPFEKQFEDFLIKTSDRPGSALQ